MPRHSSIHSPAALSAALLIWYDRHHRNLPWRARPGETADPYRVWLSEIMLQQTTVATVGPYYKRFVARWPDVVSLAESELDAVLQVWQGLGYYARARNLHACARAVVRLGRFPETEADLRALPGIGDYTAAAIAAIAFGRHAAAVDGNAERVLARIYGVQKPLPAAKAHLRNLAAALVPRDRPGDFAQALMDLGATLCTPKKPRCPLCPWCQACRARKFGLAENLPRRVAKSPKPKRHGVAFWAVNETGAVLLRRRPVAGLLGGMMEVPSTEWRAKPWHDAEAKRMAPFRARWQRIPGVVAHSFTHFDLELTILAGAVTSVCDGLWIPPENMADQALPSVMKKVIDRARNARLDVDA